MARAGERRALLGVGLQPTASQQAFELIAAHIGKVTEGMDGHFVPCVTSLALRFPLPGANAMPPTYLLARDHLQRAVAILQGADSRSRQLRYIVERTISLLEDRPACHTARW